MKDKNTISSFKRGKINENETEQNENKYIATANSQQVSNLALINRNNKNLIIDYIADKATIEINGTEIEIIGTDPRKLLGAKNGLIFDYVTTNLVLQNEYGNTDKLSHVVNFSLDDYAKDFGRTYTDSSKTNARKHIRLELKKAFTALQNTKIKLKGDNGQESSTVFCSSFVIGRDVISFEYPIILSKHLIESPISFIPRKLFEIAGKYNKNKNIYPIGRKLSEHYHIYNNQLRGTNDILSVKSLLKVASDTPSYEEVMKTNRDWQGRIVETITQNLDLLQDENVIRWEWCNSKKAPLTEKQAEIPSYNTFENFYIKFEMIDAKRNTKQLKDWKKRQKKRSKKTKKGDE